MPLLVAGTLIASVLAGCSVENIPGVYRVDIQQGNVITQEMLDQLESGMERRKVRYILGTPMLTDTFNENRWDYYYSYSEGRSDPVRRRISVFFDGDKLARVEGDVLPGAARRPLVPRKEIIVTVPPSSGGEGIFSALKPDFFGSKKKPPPAAGQQEPDSPTPPAVKSEGDTPAAEDAGAITAASAPPVPVPVPSPRDEEYLQRLFEGFGKADTGTAGSVQDPAGGTEVQADDAAGVTATAERDRGEDTEDSGGFIKRLIDRLRPASESDSTDAAAPADASPPSAPAPASPGGVN